MKMRDVLLIRGVRLIRLSFLWTALMLVAACSGDGGGNSGNDSGDGGQPSGTFVIAGQVTLDGNGLQGVTISLSGTSVSQRVTDVGGSYSFEGAGNGGYTITPTLTGYRFTPASRNITINGIDVTGQDFAATDESLSPPSSGTVILPDTGQTTCYNASGFVISCAGTGLDGAYTINPMSYRDGGDGTVVDAVTGLVWQKDSPDNTKTWQEAASYCTGLTLAGQSDWRLPSMKELMSIVDYSVRLDPNYPLPAITAEFFPDTRKDGYWSSTASANRSDGAWYVDFSSGVVISTVTNDDLFVRCLRGAESGQPNLVANANGTVTDERTGLLWQQTASGAMTWESATSYCEGLSLGGFNDWRLPNIKELESLVDEGRYSPAFDGAFFPDAGPNDYYLSSTQWGRRFEAYPYVIALWQVGSGDGRVSQLLSNGKVRCVRRANDS